MGHGCPEGAQHGSDSPAAGEHVACSLLHMTSERAEEGRANGPREWLGWMTGALAAAPVGAIAALRRSRMFHPRGIALRGRLDPVVGSPHDELGRGIAGHALVRLSGALFKPSVERLEVLGLGLRISDERIVSTQPRERDQDLTFATILSPLSMPISPFTTRSDDFMANRYHAVAPFRVAGVGRMKLRLVPEAPPLRTGHEGRRADRLEADVRAGRAVFVLEVRRTLTRAWIPVARLVLTEIADVDQEALRFDPFRDGRGVTPVGFVHAMRRATYAASQAARPRMSPEPEVAGPLRVSDADGAWSGAPASMDAGGGPALRPVG